MKPAGRLSIVLEALTALLFLAFLYPFALILMAASAVVPMWYFRRRGWLK